MDGVIHGYLGADAKETEKGFTFSVADKYRENGKEETLWVNCFQNYQSNIFNFLKRGTPVLVFGEVTVGIYKRGEEEYMPRVTCFVTKIKLLPNRQSE